MSTRILKTQWPIDDPLYFYLEAIEEYLPGCRVRVAGHGEMIMLGGYSYLGLNGQPKINRAAQDAIERYGTGTFGARLLAGSLDLHRKLEARIATFTQTEAAVTFSSGYVANMATLECLLKRHDTVICDKLVHASVMDGCHLSGAKLRRFRHNDMEHLEKCLRDAPTTHRTLVVVDAVYGMDGDVINLPEVSRLCRKYGAWLMVDEAHSIGVLGRTGRGIYEHFDLPADSTDIKMGSLGKSIPSTGGYIAGTRELCRYLSHESRSFVYSGSVSPPAAAAALAALDVIEDEPERVNRLHDNIVHFANGLRRTGLNFMNSTTSIFPIICGEDYAAWQVANHCQKRGVYVQAIPYPVVPMGTARLRVVVTADHDTATLDHCIDIIREAMSESRGNAQSANA
jgi:glycine C-acetyltransferase